MLDMILDPNYENFCLKKELLMIFYFFKKFLATTKISQLAGGWGVLIWTSKVYFDLSIALETLSGKYWPFPAGKLFFVKYHPKIEQKWTISHFFWSVFELNWMAGRRGCGRRSPKVYFGLPIGPKKFQKN